MNRPTFTLRQLEYFIAAADAGTISEAATRLHVSQPGLSQAISELERALDVQLTVRRKAHGVSLTAAGAQVLQHARELMSRAQDVQSIATGDALGGSLQLGCYVTLAPTALPPLLQGFRDLHPGVDIHFTEDTQDVLQQRLLRGEMDVAILYDMELEPEMTHAVIDSVRPHILLSAQHPMAKEPHVSLADLIDEPQVLLDAPPSSHNTLAIFQHFGLTPDVRYRPRTIELTRALVGRGLGYALLVQRPANNRTYEGKRIVIKEIAEDVGSARVVFAWPKSVKLNRRAAALVEFGAHLRYS
jgi:DNA-binding transcriptional LysR family regulator